MDPLTESWMEVVVANLAGGYREDTLEGRPHLVVNGAILGEDVIDGNRGPIFYPDDENAAAVPQWDHMPIVNDHPTAGSARTVSYLNASKIGVVLNTRHDAKAKKVRPEFWFDKERTKALTPTVYDAILNKQPVEVSSGLSMKLELKAGTHLGKPYGGVARKQAPDHVAVLQGKVGAYSVAMGGGIYANAAPETDAETRTVLARTLAKAVAGVNVGVVLNELSFDQIASKLSRALASKHGEKGRYWDGWIEQVYQDHVVFCDGHGKMFDQPYTATDSGVSLTGSAAEVVRTVSYEPVTNASRETETVEPTTYINDLITNGGYTEGDRPWLVAFGPNVVKIKKVAVVNAVPPPAAPVPVPVPVTLQSLVANADPLLQAAFNDMQVTSNAEKAKLVDQITKAHGNQFRPEDLSAMPVQNLRMIAALIPAPVQNAMAGTYPTVSLNTPLQPAWLGTAGGVPPAPAPVHNAAGAPQVPVLGLPGTFDFSKKN